MNSNDSYQSWIERKRSIECPDGFSQTLLNRILQNQPRLRAPRLRWEPHRLLEWVSLRPLVQTVIIALAFAAGALRLVLMMQVVLSY